MQELIKIGRTGKAFGAEGALKLKVEDQFLDDFLEASAVFIELLGKPVPFFIAQIHKESPLIIKLEEVDSREAALDLAGKNLLLRRDDITESALNEPATLSALEGFRIFDRTLGEIGQIEEVLELPEQLMAALQYEGREVLIPLSNQLILGVDDDARRIDMDLPEGLLEL